MSPGIGIEPRLTFRKEVETGEGRHRDGRRQVGLSLSLLRKSPPLFGPLNFSVLLWTEDRRGGWRDGTPTVRREGPKRDPDGPYQL